MAFASSTPAQFESDIYPNRSVTFESEEWVSEWEPGGKEWS